MESYLLQLEQVNLALASENCTNRDELCQLQSDLLDLIQLHHESGNEATNSAENSVVENINNDSSEDSNSDSDSDSDDNFRVGSRCRAPYSDKSGFQRFISYHNAIVFELEPPDTENTDRKATVMFCNPLTKSMQPCPYFLNGTCNYVDKCRYSHGECVSLEDLKKYEEPDFEYFRLISLTECSTCLVKREDDLWKLCRITAISIEEQSAAVCIIETHEEVRAPFSSFLPITVDTCDNNGDNDVPGCSGMDMEEVSSSPDNEDSFIGKQNSSHHAWSDDYLGGWEKHTKGVASKLMVKMGYVPGQGLGKESDGRVEPVEAKILPKGQSLDRCADTSEKKDPLKKIKKKNRKAKLNEQRNQKNFLRKIVSSKKSNVFDVINKRLSAINVKAKFGSNSANYVQESLTECNDKDLNVKLFNVQEKIRTEERHGVQYKLSISRNESKDKIVHGQSKSKLSQSQERLVALKIREKALLSEIDNRKSHKKSCQF